MRERDLAHAHTRREESALADTRRKRSAFTGRVCARVYQGTHRVGPPISKSGSQAADKSARPIVVINLPRRLALGCPRPAAVHVMVIVPVLTRGPLGASCVGGNGGGGNGGGCHADSALLSLGDVSHFSAVVLGRCVPPAHLMHDVDPAVDE